MKVIKFNKIKINIWVHNPAAINLKLMHQYYYELVSMVAQPNGFILHLRCPGIFTDVTILQGTISLDIAMDGFWNEDLKRKPPHINSIYTIEDEKILDKIVEYNKKQHNKLWKIGNIVASIGNQ